MADKSKDRKYAPGEAARVWSKNPADRDLAAAERAAERAAAADYSIKAQVNDTRTTLTSADAEHLAGLMA